jgi:hypothetical protein
MRFSSQSPTQLQTIFGGGYVPEHHADKTLWNLSSSDVDEVIQSLTVSMFDEVLKALRAALSLR